MSLSALTAISPIDGRYHQATKDLGNYFSEFALIRYRVFIEIEYFIALSHSGIPQLEALTPEKQEELRDIYRNFTLDDAEWIKTKEKETSAAKIALSLAGDFTDANTHPTKAR